MKTNALSTQATATKTCGRCRGTGQHSNYGGDTRCFGCKGTGRVQVLVGPAPSTDPRDIDIDYAMGMAYRENRARDRAARKAAR